MPTTTGLATSFIQFTRASNATVTDSSGFIEWAGHNLLTNSESFDATAWTKSSATVTANTDPAPNGTTTGDTIAASGANGTALQTWTAEAVPYTFGVWLRRKTGTGTIEIAADSGTYTAVTITSSWALYTVTQTPAAGSKSAGIRIVTSADEVYAWGAHLYRSDLGGMVLNPARGDAYYPTTPKNLLGQTEAFDVSPWSNSNAGTGGTPVVTANSGLAPNGLMTADRIQFSLGGGTSTADVTRRIQVYNTVSATPYTFSFYAKSFDGTPYTLHINSAAGLTVNTVTVTGEWQRFSAIANGAGGNVNIGFGLRGGQTPTNSNTADILVWGAQLSGSASLDTYSPVYGAAVTSAAYYAPRLDFDPVTLAAKGLLVEEQRTNLVLNSATMSTQNVTVTAVAHTLSFYGTGTITLSGASTAGPLVGTGAYPNRVTLTFTPTAGTLTLTVTGSVTQAQLEAGSFATSYIPTGAATATRSADVASVSTQAFPYSATEGTIVVNGSWNGSNSNYAVFASFFIDVNNHTTLDANNTALSAQWNNRVSGTFEASIGSLNTGSSGVPFKAGAVYKLNDYAAVANGGTVGTDTSATPLTGVQNMTIGARGTSQYLSGHIRQITYIPRRLTNAELQARTA